MDLENGSQDLKNNLSLFAKSPEMNNRAANK